MSLQVQISGYNHKQPILLSKIMSKLSKFTVDDKQFEIEKEVLTRQLRNFKAEQPHTHAKYYLSLLTDNMAWTKEELASAVEGTCTCLCKFGCYMYTWHCICQGEASPRLHVHNHLCKIVSTKFVFNYIIVTNSEQLQQFLPELLAQVHVEALVHGNISLQVHTSAK